MNRQDFRAVCFALTAFTALFSACGTEPEATDERSNATNASPVAERSGDETSFKVALPTSETKPGTWDGHGHYVYPESNFDQCDIFGRFEVSGAGESNAYAGAYTQPYPYNYYWYLTQARQRAFERFDKSYAAAEQSCAALGGRLFAITGIKESDSQVRKLLNLYAVRVELRQLFLCVGPCTVDQTSTGE